MQSGMDASMGNKQNVRDWSFTSSYLPPPQLSAEQIGCNEQSEKRSKQHCNTNLGFPHLACACVAGNCTLVAECAVGLELTLLLRDFPGCLVNVRFGKGDVGTGGGSSQVIAL